MQYTLKRWRKVTSATGSVAGSAMLAMILTVCLAGSVFAANGIMLQIQDRPLKEVVMLLSKQSGINIVIADEANLEKKITVSLNDVPLETALDYVVKAAGVSYKRMDDGTFIIGGSQEAAPAFSLPDIKDVLPSVEPMAAPQPREQIVTKITLTHSQPSALLRLLGWSGQNPMPNCDARYPDRLSKDQSRTNNSNRGAVYTKDRQGNVQDLKSGISSNNQPVIPTVDPRAVDSGSGRTADQMTGAAQVPGMPPGFGNSRTSSRDNNTNSNSKDSSSNSKNDNFLWPDGIDNAVPFDLDNSIIVKGDEEAIAKFKNIVRMLDVPPKQVQIKAEFVEVKTVDVKNFGIDWSLERLNESFSTAFAPQGNVVVGLATGNLTAQLKAQLTEDIGRTINSPIISTINNQNAYISIDTVIPYWTSYAVSVGDGQVINEATPNFMEIDTSLSVLPRVNGDGTITMMLQPRVSDTGNNVVGPDGTSIPEERYQELFTQRRVANGETIVVGGFIRKNDATSIQKVPILGDLPLVGTLFRTTAKSSDERELLIFVTPTIIPDNNSGTVGGVTP